MEVSAIERTRRGRYSVFLDGEFYCALHGDVFALSGLSAGCMVEEERLEELRRLSEGRIARERALRLLGQRAYTEQGLYRKLCEKTGEEAAAETVARMIELGLVDDGDYARRYAAECIESKGYAPSRIRRELLNRGIDREIADEALEQLEQDPRPAIARIVLRKYRQYLGDEKGLRRTIGALSRLGYLYGDIQAVIADLQEDEEYYNE